MVPTPRLICRSEDLAEGGRGVRFEVDGEGMKQPAFVVRHRGRVHAYINRCAHVGVELDWRVGEFFDDSGLYLLCATHGAIYVPDSGFCVAGPCVGRRLAPLAVLEKDGGIFLK